MENNQNKKAELREIKLCIVATRVLLFFYKVSTIQITGLLLATFWSMAGYYMSGNFNAAPFVFIATFLIVKYWWIPDLKIEESRKEMEEILIECINEKKELRATMKSNLNETI